MPRIVSSHATSASVCPATISANMARADTPMMSEATFQALAFLFPDRTPKHQPDVILIVSLRCFLQNLSEYHSLKNTLPQILLARNGAKTP
jgi:hypothetical protein